MPGVCPSRTLSWTLTPTLTEALTLALILTLTRSFIVVIELQPL